jgi:hypothetical protein
MVVSTDTWGTREAPVSEEEELQEERGDIDRAFGAKATGAVSGVAPREGAMGADRDVCSMGGGAGEWFISASFGVSGRTT